AMGRSGAAKKDPNLGLYRSSGCKRAAGLAVVLGRGWSFASGGVPRKTFKTLYDLFLGGRGGGCGGHSPQAPCTKEIRNGHALSSILARSLDFRLSGPKLSPCPVFSQNISLV